jgi:hypothetical protein
MIGSMVRSNAEIVELLRSASANVFWMSETDAPFTVLLWEELSAKTMTPARLLRWLQRPRRCPVTQVEVEAFFADVTQPQDWHGEEEVQTVQQYQQLLTALQDNLTDLQVYRLGEITIDIYIVGKTPSGQWISLMTQAVET